MQAGWGEGEGGKSKEAYAAGAPSASEAWQISIYNDIACLQKAQVNKVNILFSCYQRHFDIRQLDTPARCNSSKIFTPLYD